MELGLTVLGAATVLAALEVAVATAPATVGPSSFYASTAASPEPVTTGTTGKAWPPVSV